MDNDPIWNLIAKKISGEAIEAELKELETALRRDPTLHYTLEAFQDMWKDLSESETELTEKAFQKHLDRMQRADSDYFAAPSVVDDFIQTKQSRFRRLAPGTLILCLILFGIYFITKPTNPITPAARLSTNKAGDVVTQYGTRTKLLLPDGTSVWLNAGSRLSYDSSYGNVLREVSLSGEGYFDVIKNKGKPFLIHTGNIDIRVLGTSFNVKSYPGDRTIETSLIRGKIEVSFRDKSRKNLILIPNQKLVLLNEPADKLANEKIQHNTTARNKPEISINALTHFGKDSLITETAWMDNKLVFQDESFLELAKKMERWYGVKMLFDDQSLSTLHFTGSFEKENIQQALKALQLLSNFNFTIKNGEAHILKTT